MGGGGEERDLVDGTMSLDFRVCPVYIDIASRLGLGVKGTSDLNRTFPDK